MWTTWGDFDRTLAMMDELRRRVDRAFEGVVSEDDPGASPRVNLFDAGDSFVLQADLPGMDCSALEVTANQDGLSIAGERRIAPPEGCSVHRQERSGNRFSRSISFPCRIDPDRVTAKLSHGVLTLKVAKAADAQPRRIDVAAG